MFRVRFSNRFETLLDGLLDALADSPASPFEPQQVIVPSMAIRRRIELAAADRFGISANVEFSFLGQWLWRQIGRLVPVAEASPFSPSILAWRIHAILGDRAFVDSHARLRNYLRDADARMRYELALRVATLFDQYVTYRADWLATWLEGSTVAAVDGAAAQDERWQAELWRRIARESSTAREHPTAAFYEAMAAAGAAGLRDAGIPRAAHVFCLPSIAPLYLDTLRRLSRFIDLHVCALNPCREYWLDTVDRRRLTHLAAQGTLDYHEVGNALLAAWGKERKAQLTLLLDDDGCAQLDEDRFEPARGKSMLAQMQNAILDLRDLAPGSLAQVARGDRSVEVHVAHSLTRELEVLQDFLLGLFAGPNPPRPSDVLVVTPALEDAAPLIDAVFGTAAGQRRIPYVVTGRGRSGENRAARALLDLLAVAASRFPATAVMALLQQPLVARRFAIDAAAGERIRDWIRAAGIRWGADARHREQCDLPPVARHTFDDGLQRLYLGYALPSASDGDDSSHEPFDERLPAGEARGSDALALGSFSAFVRELERIRHDVARPRRAADWMQALLDVIARFLAPAQEEIEDLREVQAAIGELHAQMEAGSPDELVPLDVMRAALEAVLDDPARGGVPSGAVTFSAMSSLRNLPYRTVCIVGMNDGAWPRSARAAEFDLMQSSPRPGDRQRREDERNVFLDLLLAARETLYVSYTGRSVRDNAVLPPSVLVSELLDVLAIALAPPEPDARALATARERLVVEHPLQPFSADCFATDGDPRKRSFDREYCDALRERLEAQRQAAVETVTSAPAPAPIVDDDLIDEDEVEERLAPFFIGPLALDGDEWRSVTLAELQQFFRDPCAYLLRKRLRIRLDEIDEELADDEPFVAGYAEQAALARRLVPLYLAGRTSAADMRRLARAGTEYPPGRVGERLLQRELDELAAYADALAPALAEPCLPALEATIAVPVERETWHVTGSFGDLRRTGLLRHRYGDAWVGDYLNGWLAHVFLNVLAPDGVDRVTTWHSRDGHYVLQPLEDATTRLAALLALYRRGLTEPLHFFPRSAWEYALRGDDLRKAAAKWQGHPFSRGEKDQPSYRLALRGVADPLDAQFEACAKLVFGPLLDCIVDPRLE